MDTFIFFINTLYALAAPQDDISLTQKEEPWQVEIPLKQLCLQNDESERVIANTKFFFIHNTRVSI